MKNNGKTEKPSKPPLDRYPRGWNKKKIQKLIDHYENQTDDEAVAEDEAAFKDPKQAVVLVPRALVPKVHKLLAAHSAN
jgi:hypothetical protein